jgi:hypothetical protein
MKILFTAWIVFMIFIANAQTVVATLEDLTVPRDSFLNGKTLPGGFRSANALFPATYNAMFDFSGGWAVSSKRDTVTSGFTNQYSAKAGSGVNGSANYAVAFDRSVIRFSGRVRLDSVYLTNNTYAYNSMRDGDQFAKRFGGETGNDPDFFRLHIFKYLNGVRSQDSVLFYLADFRFANRAQDYIVRDWRAVSLTSLGEADSLLFTFASSDVGQFGINTPTYFCLDNLTTSPLMTDVKEIAKSLQVKVFPNPTNDWVQITWEGSKNGTAQLLDLNGKVIENQAFKSSSAHFNIQQLPKGVYLLRIKIEDQLFTQKIVKQ